MVRAQRTHLKLLAAALVAGTVAISCGGEKKEDEGKGPADGPGGMPGETSGTGGELTLAFNPMYSAFDDNAHEFLVPVKVTGATGALKVTTEPAGFVETKQHPEGIMLVTQKAGECTVTITDAEGNKGSAKLVVTKNGPDDVEIGKERYANGIDAFNLPEGGIRFPEGGFPGLPEGGFPEGGFNFGEGGIRFGEGGVRFPEGGLNIMRNANAACTFCHIPEGAPAENTMMGQVDVEHTPQQTAGYSDDDLIAIFTMAKKPMGAPYRIVNGGGAIPDNLAQTIYARFHTWDVAPETQKGIVAYLRSLTPKAQPAIDFGGLLRGGIPGGGRMGGGAAGGTTMPAMDAGAP